MLETIASILERKGEEVYSVASDATVHDALTIMAGNEVAAVLVIADGKLVGIVSAKDSGNRVLLQGRSATRTRVEEIMTTPLMTVPPRVTTFEAMAIMTRCRIRHLPVFKDAELVGIVSMGDLASAVISDQAFHIDQLMTYISQT